MVGEGETLDQVQERRLRSIVQCLERWGFTESSKKLRWEADIEEDELNSVPDLAEIKLTVDEDENKFRISLSIADYLKRRDYSESFKELLADAKISLYDFESSIPTPLESILEQKPLKALDDNKKNRKRRAGELSILEHISLDADGGPKKKKQRIASTREQKPLEADDGNMKKKREQKNRALGSRGLSRWHLVPRKIKKRGAQGHTLSKKKKDQDSQKENVEQAMRSLKKISSHLSMAQELTSRLQKSPPILEKEPESYDLYSKYIQHTTPEEPVCEYLLEPYELFISALPRKAEKTDVVTFFREKGFAVTVILFEHETKEYKKAKAAIVSLKSLSDTKKAVELNGELMSFEKAQSRHVYVTRSRNRRRTLCVSGFRTNLADKVIKKILKQILGAYAVRIRKVFLLNHLGFAYVVIKKMKPSLEEEIEANSTLVNWDENTSECDFIKVRYARLQAQCMEAKANWQLCRNRRMTKTRISFKLSKQPFFLFLWALRH